MQAKKQELLEKYGRLDWDVSGSTNEEKAKEGKRYEGLPILMNLENGSILSCDVIEVTEKGFLVKPLSISGLMKDDDDDDDDADSIDYEEPIPFDKFFHVFLRC